MTKYFVDYENVHIYGLKGILRLTEEDTVIIFYSEAADKLTFGLHKRLMQSSANIEYRKVITGTPNALDFQLASCVGYEIAESDKNTINIIIVSKDKGYDSIIEYWHKRGYKISRVDDITSDIQTEKNSLTDEIINLIGEVNKDYANNIYNALRERKSKEGVHNYLMKELHDNKKVSELYKLIKPLLKDKS